MYWIAVDPGETTGYSIWNAAGKLVGAGQQPMWKFLDLVYQWAVDGIIPAELGEDIDGDLDHEFGAAVCEDWQIYPWIAEKGQLNFDKCRTARAIGALTLICRQFNKKLVFQGADIKKGAQAAGAESLYLEPVHENRHANDSIQHGVFYLAVEGKSPC